jgi:hypothetical protein
MVLSKGAKSWTRTVSVRKNGEAAATFRKLSIGQFTLVATYRGDTEHLSSSATRKVRVRAG